MRVVIGTDCLIASIPPKGNYYWLYEAFRTGIPPSTDAHPQKEIQLPCVKIIYDNGKRRRVQNDQ